MAGRNHRLCKILTRPWSKTGCDDISGIDRLVNQFRPSNSPTWQSVTSIIVNTCRLVMKLDKFLCFMFLFAFLALTLHKPRQKHAFFGRITNQKLQLIYSKLTCEPKTKKLCRVTVGSTSNCDCIAPAFEIPRVS